MSFPDRPEVNDFLEGIPDALKETYWKNVERWIELEDAAKSFAKNLFPSKGDMDDLRTALANLQTARKAHIGQCLIYMSTLEPDEEDAKREARRAIEERGKKAKQAVQRSEGVDRKESTYSDVPPMGDVQ